MFFKRKLKEPAIETWEPPDGKSVKIIGYWDDQFSDVRYAINKWGFIDYIRMVGPLYGYEKTGSGDKKWAERNAKHYKVAVEPYDGEDS